MTISRTPSSSGSVFADHAGMRSSSAVCGTTMARIACSVRPDPVTSMVRPPDTGVATTAARSTTSFMSIRCWRKRSRSTLDQSVAGSSSEDADDLGHRREGILARLRQPAWARMMLSGHGSVGAVPMRHRAGRRGRRSLSPTPPTMSAGPSAADPIAITDDLFMASSCRSVRSRSECATRGPSGL